MHSKCPIAQQRATAALHAERQQRGQLENQRTTTESRLAAAEQARDAAIGTVSKRGSATTSAPRWLGLIGTRGLPKCSTRSSAAEAHLVGWLCAVRLA